MDYIIKLLHKNPMRQALLLSPILQIKKKIQHMEVQQLAQGHNYQWAEVNSKYQAVFLQR